LPSVSPATYGRKQRALTRGLVALGAVQRVAVWVIVVALLVVGIACLP
jgi:hypothetical protein